MSSDRPHAAVRIGFGADLVSAATALARQPSLPVTSVAITVLLAALPTGGTVPWAVLGLRIGVFLFMLGWYGSERVFFQRYMEGKSISFLHLVRLAKRFMGRFFRLGVWCVLTFGAIFLPLSRIFGIDFGHGGQHAPLWFELFAAVVSVGFDFALTFVTPALAYTTRSAWEAVSIGVAMIEETWPRSAAYVLCPAARAELAGLCFPSWRHGYPVGAYRCLRSNRPRRKGWDRDVLPP